MTQITSPVLICITYLSICFAYISSCLKYIHPSHFISYRLPLDHSISIYGAIWNSSFHIIHNIQISCMYSKYYIQVSLYKYNTCCGPLLWKVDLKHNMLYGSNGVCGVLSGWSRSVDVPLGVSVVTPSSVLTGLCGSGSAVGLFVSRAALVSPTPPFLRAPLDLQAAVVR